MPRLCGENIQNLEAQIVCYTFTGIAEQNPFIGSWTLPFATLAIVALPAREDHG